MAGVMYTRNLSFPLHATVLGSPGGNRLHSDDPAFAEFTGGTDPIPLYDVQAA